MKVGIITLGCDKNTVDSERYLAQLSDHSAEYTSALDEADIIIVNTCGFIDAAKKESIDAMIEAARFKTTGRCQAVVGVGCMIERHKQELTESLPEVDLFLGSSEMQKLVPELHDRGLLGGVSEPLHPGVRLYAGDLPHVRYLKISEGC
ncbi:MAG: 30S ribosomal protein S12 methylthiotransferase RimO, partial [Gemmatimonadaceae bacterium]